MENKKILSEIKKAQGKRKISITDLHAINQLTNTDIEMVFAIAKIMKKAVNSGKKDLGLLRGKAAINFFSEASTRTRVSFELAAKYLGMNVVNVVGSSSSRKKGETFQDTAETLEALSADFIVIRDSENHLPEKLAEMVKIPVLNAGDGINQHPTQALLEALTLREKFGKKKLNYLFVGDALHSRVFGSQREIYQKLGYKLHLASPRKLFPKDVKGIETFTNLDKALDGIDAIHIIRLQKERVKKGFVKNLGSYEKDFKLTLKRLEKINPKGVVLHAGPVMRDSDISSEVLEDKRSLILPMIENGLVIRMSLLWLLSQKKK
jgi:aspartate carbamoyltransferase catalytic subunit